MLIGVQTLFISEKKIEVYFQNDFIKNHQQHQKLKFELDNSPHAPCGFSLSHSRSYLLLQLISVSADSRFVPSQWETASLCNVVSHWLAAKLESALSVLQHSAIRTHEPWRRLQHQRRSSRPSPPHHLLTEISGFESLMTPAYCSWALVPCR